jgi:hypothetical protein
MMHFLTCHRTEQEHRALREKLSTCRCDFSDTAIAYLHIGEPPEAGAPAKTIPTDFDTLLGCLSLIIQDALGTLAVGKFRKAEKKKRADEQPWPSSQQDIMPNPDGVKGTVSALLRFATDPSTGHAAFSVLGAIARFWEPCAREIFRTPLAFSLATAHMQFAIDSFDPQVPYAILAKNFELPLITCAEGFFFTLVVRDTNATVKAIQPVFPQLARITVRGQACLELSGLSARLHHVNDWFDRMRILMASPGIPLAQQSSSAMDSEMFGQLIYVRNLNQCMSLECNKPLGVKTSVCVQCGIVRYCGTEASVHALLTHRSDVASCLF